MYPMSELEKYYTIWYHNPNNCNWTEDSYHQLLSFNTMKEFWVLDNVLDKGLIENGMFFIMKEDIVPIWENEKNEEGGYLSWKINRDEIYKNWIDLIGHILVGKLFKNGEERDLNAIINGCSISPKKKFNILKVWLSEPIDVEEDIIEFEDTFNAKDYDFTFKLHKINIEKDKKLNKNN